jgi:hypothetical protein
MVAVAGPAARGELAVPSSIVARQKKAARRGRRAAIKAP